MCPANPVGSVDLFVVSHHGLPTSNAAALVHAIEPRVALMNNGTRKGGNPESMTVMHSAPGLEDLWQLHFSLLSGQEYTVPGLFIANLIDDQPREVPVSPMPPPQRGSNAGPPPAHNGPANWIKVMAYRDGSGSPSRTVGTASASRTKRVPLTIEIPRVGPLGLVHHPDGYATAARRYPPRLRAAALAVLCSFVAVTLVTTTYSLGAYCLTTWGGSPY